MTVAFIALDTMVAVRVVLGIMTVVTLGFLVLGQQKLGCVAGFPKRFRRFVRVRTFGELDAGQRHQHQQ